MNIKGIIFALLAAGIGGAVGEGVERGLNAADAKLQERQKKSEDEDKTDEDKTEE